jgi:hypothetical protein
MELTALLRDALEYLDEDARAAFIASPYSWIGRKDSSRQAAKTACRVTSSASAGLLHMFRAIR